LIPDVCELTEKHLEALRDTVVCPLWPDADIILIEQTFVGDGASGRCGGFNLGSHV
jgi:hypothetical protein